VTANNYDAIVVGGGHNGHVAAAYLARAGLRTVVCESRPVVGGAAVTEQPFGPDYHVTSLSYVVSLLPPSLVRDLSLERYGYHVYPQGDIGDGNTGVWGFPRGGMGGVTSAMEAAARSFGVEIRTSSPVEEITTHGGVATGVVLASGDQLSAPTVVTTAHPAISFLRLVDRAALPADFVADIERWKSRSGVVKVNLAVDRLPEFSAKPGFDPEVHGGTIVLAESLGDLEQSFQDAVGGRASGQPFASTRQGRAPTAAAA